MWMERHYAPFGELLHTVRTSEPPADLLCGQPFFSWLCGQPGQVARFTGAMADLTSGIRNAVIPVGAAPVPVPLDWAVSEGSS